MGHLGGRLEGVGERPQQPRNNKSRPFTGRPRTRIGRLGATETNSSHVIMLSQPDLVIDVIRKAASTVQKSRPQLLIGSQWT
jgi:hypothetical protein